MLSLLQPPPEVYDLFDDLILMAKGRVVYHGPADAAVAFFTGLGFVRPPRKVRRQDLTLPLCLGLPFSWNP